MLGTFRFVLAAMVVVAHLGGIPIANHYGVYAVLGFFVVSGFLITSVLNETYKGRSGAFWANRFLRLYPPYYLAMGVSLFLLLSFPEEASSFRGGWLPTSSTTDWIAQFTIVPVPFFGADFRIIPPTWSVAVEIVQYFILWAFVARGRRTALAALAFGIAYHLYCYWSGWSWQPRYYTYFAAVLPFSVGALTYFALKDGYRLRTASLLAVIPLWLANLVLPVIIQIKGYAINLGLYVNVALVAAIVLTLAPVRWSALPAKIDKALGDLSYPAFLIHWIAGLCIYLLWPTINMRSPEMVLAATPIILGGSYLIAKMADAAIEPIRDSLRRSDDATGLQAQLTAKTA